MTGQKSLLRIDWFSLYYILQLMGENYYLLCLKLLPCRGSDLQ